MAHFCSLFRAVFKLIDFDIEVSSMCQENREIVGLVYYMANMPFLAGAEIWALGFLFLVYQNAEVFRVKYCLLPVIFL